MGVLLLAGCASFSNDGGFEAVQGLSREHIAAAPTYQRTAEPSEPTRARITELLQQPLSVDGAVELALLNNRTLQAAYAELGIAEADLVRAGRLANPSFSFGRLGGQGTVDIDRALMFDVMGLLTMPLARRLEQQRFEQVQLQAAQDTLAVATQARQAWVQAVAARQLAAYAGTVGEAAQAASELARRMQAVGNFNALDHLREQAFEADAKIQITRARQQAVAAHEQLVRVLGLDGTQALALASHLPERLPALPAEPLAPKAAEQAAVDRRLDVRLARRAAEATAQSLGLTRATGFVNVLHAGYQNTSGTGEARRNGYEIELELPLFDFGSTRAARAEAVYMQAVHRTAAVAVNAQSEVREAHAAYQDSFALARHYESGVLPLRQRISEQMLLRYNGMLSSVFDLLADAREQVGAVIASVDALREHWLAEARLQAALAGPAPAADTPARALRAATAGSLAAGH